ncbi:MAG TPA: DUF4384 domain-containing protein [Burkholderiales bacterium]|nr:DUF4384 domain-containing protein [Burkholderiales bacterium]
MISLRLNFLSRIVGPLAIGAALAGCSAMDVKTEAVEKTNALKKGPESAPHRSITNFSAALRCMDDMMIDYGVRDVSLLVEDLVDTTKKVNAGTKDMLISAVSDMTKRSRALRLIAFGPDSNNLINFIRAAERKGPFSVIPQFDIKGSITQLDERMIQKQADAGIGVNLGSSGLSIGYAKDAASSILGLDLTILNANDLSVVPGVTSRNSVVIFKEGKAIDGDATIKKLGVNYSMSLSKSEGQSQALRNLVELAVIELFGKLTRTPYWICLGADPDDEAIQTEISDWFYAMYANPKELAGYFQHKLRLRGYYSGPLDGVSNPQLLEAAAKYRVALGLSEEPKIDLEFFRAYLQANHRKVVAKFPPPPQPVEATPATSAQSAPAKPLNLSIQSTKQAASFQRGEPIGLFVQPSRDAHVYCYLLDETQKIQRFYPNRFNKDSLVQAAAPLEIPGKMRFQLSANDKGVKETVACFATEQEVMTKLPGTVAGIDFEYLPVTSLDQVRDAFARANGGTVAEGYFHVQVR